ncbi:MAG: SAM-dependent methyltransferase [Saprospiraceae bacterium]|nr:SAM-dependent methyltransferase [Saprospiraceae bacterium]
MNQEYWNERYALGETGWDIGFVSTPIKEYIDQIDDKTKKILVPGAGNAYEVEYLYNQGFTNIFVLDIASLALEALKKRLPSFPDSHIIHDDFFKHHGTYDIILEQTFFCALDPSLRAKYTSKMNEILSHKGKLVGVLFSSVFPFQGPPFGGTIDEYQKLFAPSFNVSFEPCYNSIEPRMGNELWMKGIKGSGIQAGTH